MHNANYLGFEARARIEVGVKQAALLVRDVVIPTFCLYTLGIFFISNGNTLYAKMTSNRPTTNYQ